MVHQHHERWDGRGYPDGISGEDIIREARILAVADVFDAMTSDRPYRESMPPEKAVSIIHGEAGRQFDPAIVAAFVELMAGKDILAA
jgi:HD-GYP domain-containing protein (c-di-GMP phosphodiesterase class II)